LKGIDSNGLPISVRYEVVGFLKDTNQVWAYTSSYRHIRVGMKVFDTERAFCSCNEEELVEAIHEAMSLKERVHPRISISMTVHFPLCHTVL
jgi:hypothetical protein